RRAPGGGRRGAGTGSQDHRRRAVEARVVAERRGHDLQALQVDGHGTALDFGAERAPPALAGARDAAADHDHARVEEVQEVHDADAHGARRRLHQLDGQRVAGLGRRVHLGRGGRGAWAAEDRRPAGGEGFSGLVGDGGARGERLQAAVVAAVAAPAVQLDRHVAGLAGDAAGAEQQVVIDDDAAADTGADGEVDHVGDAAARAEAVLAEGGEVSVVAGADGQVAEGGQAVGEGQVFPAGQVGGLVDDAAPGVDGAGCDDANAHRARAGGRAGDGMKDGVGDAREDHIWPGGRVGGVDRVGDQVALAADEAHAEARAAQVDGDGQRRLGVLHESPFASSYNTRMAASREPPLVVLTGPTAVGKSALALELAERFGGEILSADSRQVYRYLDIGTAKPTAAERARVPHHLLDLVDPDEPFSVADYQAAADAALADVGRRGRVALLVGGSPHYVQAVVDRLALPRVAPRPELRATLEALAAREGPLAVWERLRALDAAAAERADRYNVRRLIRAIEVVTVTGEPLAVAMRRRGPERPALHLALTAPRAELYARIDARIEAMLAAGWLAEVEGLLARGYAPTLPSLSATGYRELIEVARGELALAEAVTLIRHRTHAFARRQ